MGPGVQGRLQNSGTRLGHDTLVRIRLLLQQRSVSWPIGRGHWLRHGRRGVHDLHLQETSGDIKRHQETSGDMERHGVRRSRRCRTRPRPRANLAAHRHPMELSNLFSEGPGDRNTRTKPRGCPSLATVHGARPNLCASNFVSKPPARELRPILGSRKEACHEPDTSQVLSCPNNTRRHSPCQDSQILDLQV